MVGDFKSSTSSKEFFTKIVHSSKDFVPTNPIRTESSNPTNVSKKKNVSQPRISEDTLKFSNNDFSQTHNHKPNQCSSQCCTQSTQSKSFFYKNMFSLW